MSLHDEYARRTPLEIAFPEWEVLEGLERTVGEEAGRRGVDTTNPEVFVTLPQVGDAVRNLADPDAPADASFPLAALLFHGVHFVGAGGPLYLVDIGVVRRLTSGTPEGSDPRPPTRGGYLQFPQHLLWTNGTPRGGGPESLDGLFWTLARSGLLHVLAVSGLRPDRPGFGALPLPAAPLADAPAWAGAGARTGGRDFSSSLPGAELDGLYSIEVAGEVLKLLARFFVLAASSAARLGPGAGPGSGASTAERAEAGAPPRSALPYTRVSLGG